MFQPDEGATARVAAWLEANLGGTVVHIARQPRWRPVWFADVERDGERLELCIRGDRTDMQLIFPLDHEMRFQRVLHEHGIPVAKVYGWIDDPMSFVMDRVPGEQDFAHRTDEERRAAVDDYLQILARMHALPVEPFAEAGILRAATPDESGLLGLRRYEAVYRAAKDRLPNYADPQMEFFLAWLKRNPPRSRGREAPVVWDSGQFHNLGGRITAVLDLELGHIGDPMMDLAGWRMRDTIVGFGDFAQLYDRYAELRGEPVDLEAVQLHHIAFTLTNQLVFGAALHEPPPESDFMTNLQWCCETNLFATEALADYLGAELPTVEMPAPKRSRGATASSHLIRTLRTLTAGDDFVQYKLRGAFRLARHLDRVDEIGDALSDADLDDLHQLFGHRPATWEEGEAELERFVLADAETGAHDLALLDVFHKRNLRAHMLLGPAGSAMARHNPIQPFTR